MTVTIHTKHDWTVEVAGGTYGIAEYENLAPGQCSVYVGVHRMWVPTSAPVFALTIGSIQLGSAVLVVWFATWTRKRFTNPAASGKGAIARWFTIGHRWPGVGEPAAAAGAKSGRL